MRWLRSKLSWQLRAVVAAASLLLAAAMFLPIWDITLYSNQYPEGLSLWVHSGGFEAGEGGSDLTEINTLNHYIGMRPLREGDIPELRWIGGVVASFIGLALVAALLGRVGSVAVVLLLFGAFGVASFWRFYARLYEYGHNLDPRAAVTIPPFTPPLVGTEQLANFTVESYPAEGSYLMMAFGVVLLAVVLLAWRRERSRFAAGTAGTVA